ncbi:MAG: elongation factor Ts [Candidatus Omnitrophica bacterium]|nr:elongation factor Ts [Candidatus Omnitrophota bacterium]
MAAEKDTIQLISKLRELTGAGILNCKQALTEAGGDITKAQDIIRAKGLDIAKKKGGRETKEGQIFSYIHTGGKLGVLLEINCETDFVARTESFQQFAKDLTLQIASGHPLYVSSDNIPAEDLAKEKLIYIQELQGKPEAVAEKILQGKLAKRFEEICLLNQKFIKDDTRTIQEYVNEVIAKTGENIVIRRFIRFEVGGQS